MVVFCWFQRVLSFFIIFVLCLPPLVAAAEEKISETVSLKRVLDIVTETHPEILEAMRQYDSVLAERSIAKSGYYPTIGTELSGGQEVTDGVASNDEKENLTAGSATLYLQQNLYNGGKTTAFVKETDARIFAAAYEVLNVSGRIYLETTEAYLNVLKAEEMLALSKENVLTQEKILEQVREKTESGFNRISDLKNSEARMALARSNFISRQQDLNLAIVNMHRQVGRFLDHELFVKPVPAYKFPDTIEETVDIALKNHPALYVAKYNVQVRKFAYEKAKGGYLPTVDFELKAQHSSDTGGDEGETDQASAMFKVNYTFFDGGIRRGEKKKGYESLRKENKRSYVERRNVNQTARLAWNIMLAEIDKKKYLDDYVAMSSTTLDAFKEEYHIGRRTLLDLLNMENEFNSAKNSRVESSYSYLSAYFRIAQATGILLHEYDTGLREKLNLPPGRNFDLQGYEELNSDLDGDSVEDIWDQCDNSVDAGNLPQSGCKTGNLINLGYEAPAELSPYILPDEGTPEELNLKIDKRKSTQIITLDNINFKYNSVELTESSREKLTFVGHQLKATAGLHIKVIGHTDNVGSASYNKKLSQGRARSVYTELIQLGIKKEWLSWAGKGEEEPVASNDTEEGRQKNRRTEFLLTKIVSE